MISRFAAVEEVDVDGADAVLTSHERARRDRLVHDADRAAYVAAHLLVRSCVASLVGIAPSDVVIEQTCSDCGERGHGQPRVVGREDVHVSWSHTRTHVAAVAAHDRCGIDVEARSERVMRAALTAGEQLWVQAQDEPELAFTQLWVRKEALIKAGVGDMSRVAELDVLTARDGVDVQEWQTAQLSVVGCTVVRRSARVGVE